ncbi:antitoxin MazE-like protein [Paraburkholderia sp. Cpub6]|uniref:antitoxin MazE-like protein n=1 Tax=Paraburkholderia sp. Cpub6 TaxID=2723094 RepID=UPI001611F5D2|nr:antitoxin MazE-like protein [Paraburkholderia sp. Cpub6]MBB5463830.1 hypothetical protein [Paraburkholderia sp. Cpub6]
MINHPDLRAPYSIGLPDTGSPEFIKEWRRQSRLIRDNAAAEAEDMAFIEQVVDLDDWE